MPRDAIGLDIGGANLKVATASGRAILRPFELWKYSDRLAEALASIASELPADTPVGVTMTGELCDCYPTKRDGVRHILAAIGQVFPTARTRVWCTAGELVPIEHAIQQYLAVAAANWHALATYAGRFAPAGFAQLVDIGSTTTDIIPLIDGRPVPQGQTDSERLSRGELVYTGTRRTPICAILGSEVAAEFFATVHDAYLCLGMMPEEPGSTSTADGRPATIQFAHARLARMLGSDVEETQVTGIRALARKVIDRQRVLVANAIRTIALRLPTPPRTVIVSGSGEGLARAAVEESLGGTGVGETQIISLASRLSTDVSHAACAYALAVLVAEAEA